MFEPLLAFIVAHPFITFAILAALVFDFVNGFHDSANAIATVVATKVLTPGKALLLAGVMNFLGPFLLGTAVAATIGKGIIQTGKIEAALLPGIIVGALTGAILWNLITWYVGLPSSSSHALVGGLIGAALAAVGPVGLVSPTWAEMLAIGETVVVGAVIGVAAGFVAFGLSHIRLPRPMMLVLGLAGAVAMGVLYFNTHALPDAGSWQKILRFALIMTTMLFLGAIGGAILWVTTQQRMSLKLVPGFALFGACATLVVAVLVETLKLGGITKTVLFMVVSPVLGFFSGFFLSAAVSWFALRREPSAVSAGSKKAQIFSASFYALMHGTNDAQKTMGIIAVLLIAAGAFTADPTSKELDIPTWVFLSAAGAMGLGTLFGGWRIIKTMASKITHLTPIQGFAAETGGGVVLVGMAEAGIPVSTTHAITASIMGVGATKRASAVSWGVGRRIVGAWIFTIPASALVAFLCYYLVTPWMLDWWKANPVVAGAIFVVLTVAGLAFWRLEGSKRAPPAPAPGPE